MGLGQWTLWRRLAPAIPALCFFTIGCALIPYPGIQNDEALFAPAIYGQPGMAYEVSLTGIRIPLMVMSYVGALKSWLYAIVFALWHPSVWSTRVPVVLVGAATVWLFYLLLARISGIRAAVIGSAILATDCLFLLTTCFDWGPVAIQHLLLVSSMLLFVRFHESGSAKFLSAGAFCLGLGLWDKAIFAWSIVGLAAACLAACRSALVRRFSLRHAGIAAASFVLGTLPLLVYNVAHPLQTVKENASHAGLNLAGKLSYLIHSLDGSALFGYLVPLPVGEPLPFQQVLLPWAVAASLLALPFLWRTAARPAMLFAVVFMAVAWFAMICSGGGGSVHHTVLLWPMPHLLVAVTLVGISERVKRFGKTVAATAAVLLVASNLLVLGQYGKQLSRRELTTVWTDAIYPLAGYLESVRAYRQVTMDWGIVNSLCLLKKCTLPSAIGTGYLSGDSIEATGLKGVTEMMADGRNIYISHIPGNEVFARENERFRTIARDSGYRRDILRVIHDGRGRPVFEVYRLRPADGPER
jgi:hypothetical protein